MCLICSFVIFANYHFRTFISDEERRTVSGDKESSCQGDLNVIQYSIVYFRDIEVGQIPKPSPPAGESRQEELLGVRPTDKIFLELKFLSTR